MINKKVIHTNMHAHPIIVYDCPLNIRIFNAGSKQGQSYACVFDDCYNCRFGNVRKAIKNFNNEDIECGRILSVDCNADTSLDIDSNLHGSFFGPAED